jgi:O-acetyl-ADP-ribose deacetylase (regulator of RNase III)
LEPDKSTVSELQVTETARILLQRGDITTVATDAIVNAANEHLLPGGGVSGAIHCAGGPSIAAEGAAIGHCPTGDAVATTAGSLPARYVIHAVAPIWQGGSEGEPEQLASAYRRSLDVAASLGLESIAFPSLGTGIYGYPVHLAAPVALETARQVLARGGTAVREVRFILFSDSDLEAYRQALSRL